MDFISIPEDRKAVLIGKNGATKKKIEQLTKTRVFLMEDIGIEGDPVDMLKTKEIVKAIGRGFPPALAFQLAKENTELITIKVSGTEKTAKRLLARVIGTSGKAKKNIEFLTGARISVYGRTVSIIGEYASAENARAAVESIISGSRHGYVYKHLESKASKKVGTKENSLK